MIASAHLIVTLAITCQLTAGAPTAYVVVIDKVGVADSAQADAKRRVTEWYAAAGVSVAWDDQFKVAHTPLVLVITPTEDRLIGLRPSREWRVSTAEALGRSATLARRAYVFTVPMIATAKHFSVSFDTVLAMAMAHELGHLLRGPRHDPAGLMRATWGPHDFTAAASGAWARPWTFSVEK